MLLLLRFMSLVIRDVAKVKLLVKLAGSFFARKDAKNDHDSCTLVMTFNAESEQSARFLLQVCPQG